MALVVVQVGIVWMAQVMAQAEAAQGLAFSFDSMRVVEEIKPAGLNQGMLSIRPSLLRSFSGFCQNGHHVNGRSTSDAARAIRSAEAFTLC